MAGKRRASSAVSSSKASHTSFMGGGDGQAQRQRSHSSGMQTQHHQLQHHHRGSIGGGILNGLRKVRLFRRNTLDSSRIRQPLMEESQAVSITPQHLQAIQPLHVTSNATDGLMEMTTDVKATIEEDNAVRDHGAHLHYDTTTAAATAATTTAYATVPTSTMPVTTTKSYQNLSSNTTTALVSISTATTASPSATSFQTPSTICASSAEILNETSISNGNGNKIRGPEGHPYKPATTLIESSLCSSKDIASCAGGGGGLVLVTTTNNNLSLHNHRMVDENL